MIKVLDIISDTNIGGAGRVLINYLKYMDRENFSAAVLLPRGSALAERLRPLGAEIIEADGIADRSFSPGAVKELERLIKKADPDIVHTHGSLSGRIAARRCGKTVIYTRHSAFPVPGWMRRGPGRWLNKYVNEKYADRIIAVSPAAAQNLTDGGISPKLIDVMMNGVEPVARADAETCEKTRERLGLGGGFVLGILARIEEYKGHLDILEALAKLRGEGRDARLVVAGSGSFEPEVRKRAEELGLSDAVAFAGFIDDVAPVLSVMDLQLNASYGTETSSLSILEGFSMGLPAVVSDYGGNPCLVTEGVNGFLFRTRDPDGLAEKIRRVMDDRALLERLGEGARRVYEEKFTGGVFARNVENVYRRALAARGGRSGNGK